MLGVNKPLKRTHQLRTSTLTCHARRAPWASHIGRWPSLYRRVTAASARHRISAAFPAGNEKTDIETLRNSTCNKRPFTVTVTGDLTTEVSYSKQLD